MAAGFTCCCYLAIGILSDRPAAHNYLFPLLLIVMIVPTFFIRGWRYLQTLKFLAIPTNFDAVQNQNLIKLFLELQQLVTFRHPQMPEIFQIVSRNIDSFGEQHEVLIFIADDKRILLNSHFTYSSKWRIHAGARHDVWIIKFDVMVLYSGINHMAVQVKILGR